ncbi:hypothetical protein OJ252_1700, partial [Cryptosporidium canis]
DPGPESLWGDDLRDDLVQQEQHGEVPARGDEAQDLRSGRDGTPVRLSSPGCQDRGRGWSRRSGGKCCVQSDRGAVAGGHTTDGQPPNRFEQTRDSRKGAGHQPGCPGVVFRHLSGGRKGRERSVELPLGAGSGHLEHEQPEHEEHH